MLQGIPGQVFKLEEKSFTFKIHKDFEVIGYSLTSDALFNIFEPLMESGTYFLHLKEFVEYFMSYSQIHGLVI